MLTVSRTPILNRSLWRPTNASFWLSFEGEPSINTLPDKTGNYALAIASPDHQFGYLDYYGLPALSSNGDWNNYLYYQHSNTVNLPTNWAVSMVVNFSSDNLNVIDTSDIWSSASLFGDYYGYFFLGLGLDGIVLGAFDDTLMDYAIVNVTFDDYDTYHIVSASFTATSASVLIDGSTIGTTSLTAFNPNVNNNSLGLFQSYFFYPLIGQLGELVLTTPADLPKVEGYLAHKWGIPLASSHPHHRIPPTLCKVL